MCVCVYFEELTCLRRCCWSFSFSSFNKYRKNICLKCKSFEFLLDFIIFIYSTTLCVPYGRNDVNIEFMCDNHFVREAIKRFLSLPLYPILDNQKEEEENNWTTTATTTTTTTKNYNKGLTANDAKRQSPLQFTFHTLKSWVCVCVCVAGYTITVCDIEMHAHQSASAIWEIRPGFSSYRS